MSVILASGSPRRKELMKLLFDEYIVRVSSVDETTEKELTPAETVMLLSERKALAVERGENDLVIASDTVVAAGGEILGKPASRGEAAEMLRRISGRTHSVYSGVCLLYGDKKKVFYEKTDVKFTGITDDEINSYVATGECDDKAGAYGIQGRGGLFVEGINGDYNNVVGFPVARIARELKGFFP